MAKNRLNIIHTEKSDNHLIRKEAAAPSRNTRIKELQAKYERLWLMDPERFNPLRNVMERVRLERTKDLLTRHVSFHHQHAVDIGCGAGVFSRYLAEQGCQVDAVDIAENALKHLRQTNQNKISLKQEAMPATSLPDRGYDIVVCTEVIAEVFPEDYRLFFAELSRIIRPIGHLLFSSPIDIHTEQGVERLLELALTEFDVIESVPSYHALSIQINDLLETPAFYVKGWENKKFYREESQKRQGIWWLWFQICTFPLFVWIWYALCFLTNPLLNYLKNSHSCLLRLEKICRALWHERGISHYLFIAKQRPLKMVDPNEIPIEKPKRKEIWE